MLTSLLLASTINLQAGWMLVDGETLKEKETWLGLDSKIF